MSADGAAPDGRRREPPRREPRSPSAASRRSSPSASPPPRRSAASLAERRRRPGRVRRRARDAASRARRPGVPRRASAASRPGIGPTSSASAGRSSRPSSAASARRPDASERTSTWLFVADRLLREPELEARWFAFGLLERTIADEPERTWQLAPPRRPRGGRLDHGRHPRPRRRQGHPRRGLPLGGARAARLSRRRAGSGGSSAARSRRCRSSTAARGREPEVAEHGLGLIAPADRRRRAGRPEGARLGATRSMALVDRGRDDRVLRARGEHRRGDRRRPPRLGHPRRACRSSTRPTRDAPSASRLDGIRRRPGAPSTSDAAERGRAVRPDMGSAGRMPEPPLT